MRTDKKRKEKPVAKFAKSRRRSHKRCRDLANFRAGDRASRHITPSPLICGKINFKTRSS